MQTQAVPRPSPLLEGEHIRPWRHISVVCLATYKPKHSADILCNNRQEDKESGIIYIEKKSEIGCLTKPFADKKRELSVCGIAATANTH